MTLFEIGNLHRNSAFQNARCLHFSIDLLFKYMEDEI